MANQQKEEDAGNNERGDQQETRTSEDKDDSRPFSVRDIFQRKTVFLVAILFLYVMTGANYSLLAPFFPFEAERKGLTSTHTGIILSTFQIMLIIVSIIYGAYSSHIGVDFLFKAGIFISGVCTILFGTVYLCKAGTTFMATSIVIRCVESFGFAAAFAAGCPVLCCQYPKHVSFMMGLQQTFYMIGIMVGPGIGGLLYSYGGFGLPFFVSGVFVLLDGLLMAATYPPGGSPIPAKNTPPPWKSLKHPLLWVALLNIMATALTMASLEPTLALELRRINIPPSAVGAMFMIGPCVLCIVSPIQGYFIDTKGVPGLHYVLSITNGALCVVSTALIGPTPLLPSLHMTVGLVVVALVLQGLGTALVPLMKCFLIGIQESGQEINSATLAFTGSLLVANYNFGGALGTFFGGYLYEAVGFRWAATFFAAFTLATTTILTIYISWRHRDCGRARDAGENARLMEDKASIPHS